MLSEAGKQRRIRVMTADYILVHSIVIFSDISYHTLFAFASIPAKKYTRFPNPIISFLRRVKRRKTQKQAQYARLSDAYFTTPLFVSDHSP